MLEVDFKNTVLLRKPRAGSRKNASEVVWDPVLDDANEPIRIRCRLRRGGSKNFSAASVEEVSDATLLFRVLPGKDVTRENLVVDERGDVYKVLRFREEDDLELGTTYKQVELQKVDKAFPGEGP